jgi:hypothetical protein
VWPSTAKLTRRSRLSDSQRWIGSASTGQPIASNAATTSTSSVQVDSASQAGQRGRRATGVVCMVRGPVARWHIGVASLESQTMTLYAVDHPRHPANQLARVRAEWGGRDALWVFGYASLIWRPSSTRSSSVRPSSTATTARSRCARR